MSLTNNMILKATSHAMPCHPDTSDFQHLRTKAPILIGVPIIQRANIGPVYQVVPDSPHVLAFPICQKASFRIDILLSALDYSANLRIKSSAYGVPTQAANFHAEFYIQSDRAAPIFIACYGLKGVHRLVVKASCITPDLITHQETWTLLVQACQQPFPDFLAESLERFRFRIRYNIFESLILPRQVTDVTNSERVWQDIQSVIAQRTTGPREFSPDLSNFTTFAEQLNSFDFRSLNHILSICMLLERFGNEPNIIRDV